MFSLGSSQRYYLYGEPTDMPKSFDGLAGLVRSKLHLPLTTGQVFVFINKRRNRVKLLHWEAGGFVLYYKRLEQRGISNRHWRMIRLGLPTCYSLCSDRKEGEERKSKR